MSKLNQLSAQDRRNMLMERMLLKKLNNLDSEYQQMKKAEENLKKARQQDLKKSAKKSKKKNNKQKKQMNESKEDIDKTPVIVYNAKGNITQEQFGVVKEQLPKAKPLKSQNFELTNDSIDTIKSIMSDMPKMKNVPKWADSVPEDVWKKKLMEGIGKIDKI